MATTELNFNASMKANDTSVEAIANFRGWQSEVSVLKTETIDTVPNPISPAKFICDIMNKHIALKLNEMAQDMIWKNANISAQKATEANLKNIEDSLSVTFD